MRGHRAEDRDRSDGLSGSASPAPVGAPAIRTAWRERRRRPTSPCSARSSGRAHRPHQSGAAAVGSPPGCARSASAMRRPRPADPRPPRSSADRPRSARPPGLAARAATATPAPAPPQAPRAATAGPGGRGSPGCARAKQSPRRSAFAKPRPHAQEADVVGRDPGLGSLPCESSVLSQRASARSVLARRFRPRSARVSATSARWGTAPTPSSARTTKYHRCTPQPRRAPRGPQSARPTRRPPPGWTRSCPS
jgi:hypothetical protein